jgi:hypothetical protein
MTDTKGNFVIPRDPKNPAAVNKLYEQKVLNLMKTYWPDWPK